MATDDEARYRALESRDARFDGKFFTAVVTTGVYCRPICPARTPLRRNVRFFPCAAAAEEAGFRPCKRCRPETAPGTPVWNGTGASVSRAMRLIHDGYLEERSVERLATTLGMGGRHLRRLFVQHLGVPPKAVETNRRTHAAARLLAQTSLPVSSIALDSGFRSIRQFNDAFRASFGVPPAEFRRGSSRDAAGDETAPSVSLRISYRPPLDWPSLLEFYAQRAVEGVEEVTGEGYRRSFSLATPSGTTQGIVEVTDSPKHGCLLVKVSAPPVKLSTIATRIRTMFDLFADPAAVADTLAQEPMLQGLRDRLAGTRIPGTWHPFEAAVRAVVGQQITVAAAIKLLGELTRLCGTPLKEVETGAVRYVFPTPRQVYEADLEVLGMPAARKRTLKELSRFWLEGETGDTSDRSPEAVIADLLAIPGVGPWTASYVALRGFGEPDAFPSSDLGLRAAAGRRLGRTGHVAAKELASIAERWRPWRGYGAILLWQSLSPRPEANAGTQPTPGSTCCRDRPQGG